MQLVDENDSVFDRNLNILQIEHHIHIMLGNFKVVINDLWPTFLTYSIIAKLKVATSNSKKEQLYVKLVFNYSQSYQSRITSKQLLNVFEICATLIITDGVEIVNQWNNVKNSLSTPMYPL